MYQIGVYPTEQVRARSKRYQKRGGGAVRVTLVDDVAVSNEPGRDLIAVDDSLEALAKFDERKSRVIEMRFFGGLSVKETARRWGFRRTP